MTSQESFVAYVQVMRRIAIPIEVYEAMQLKEGDKVRISIEKIVVPKNSSEEEKKTLDDIDAALIRWLKQAKKEFQKQEPQPTGEWLTTYMHKLKVFDFLIESVQSDKESK